MSNPLVGIVMGSKSDLPIMEKATQVLKKFDIPYEISVMSAHRTPDRATEYSETAQKRGLKVLIAGAGGAAHLAGVLASKTTLPIIGVPINAGFSIGGGLDAMLATAQMPSGIPVATVAVDGAKNAGLLAIQIIGTHDKKVAEKLANFKKEMAEGVLSASKEVENV